jgi:hypothetical protein
MRLNVGKYGSFTKSNEQIDSVDEGNDLSAAEHEDRRRGRGGGDGNSRPGTGGFGRRWDGRKTGARPRRGRRSILFIQAACRLDPREDGRSDEGPCSPVVESRKKGRVPDGAGLRV